MSVFSSLTNRIFFATALLAVMPIGVAVYRVNVAVTAQAEQELQRGLEEAATLVDNYRRTLLEQYRREARLIADLPKLKAAVATEDPPTVTPIAQDYQSQLGSDLFVVTGRDGHVLFSVGAPEPTGIGSLEGFREARAGREGVSFWPAPGGVREVVSVPILIGTEILGTLNVGFALDEHAASRLRSLSASDISFLFNGAVQASTLNAHDRTALLRVAGATGVTRVWIGAEEYVAVSRALMRSTSAGSRPSPGVTIVLRSRTERLRVLSDLHRALGLTALVAVLAAIGLSYALARTVTRPLGVITGTMREVARSGDLTRRIPEPPATRWDDEDAKLLARTYNTMTESIARFQREAAQRERLSSLGRLSTVIAHEIRNPLMIIKAAVRPLRKEAGSSEQLRRIGNDIEEEIARLNRIVTEVLDFARPIRFELAPADLNEICRSAAAAVWAGETGWTVTSELDPELGVTVTDADRLRQALVNVLGNARQAAEAAGATPRVVLRTTRRGSVGRIVVRDNGAGIAADDLPRIFEPFFTTKRTGSGIGLAITRNIIEGLGGTVSVSASHTGGTEFLIELPLATAEVRSASA